VGRIQQNIRFTTAGFNLCSLFQPICFLTLKIYIPQNIVSTHPFNILHIEKIFGYLFLCSAAVHLPKRTSSYHGMDIAFFYGSPM
jgi:hypothetical protein